MLRGRHPLRAAGRDARGTAQALRAAWAGPGRERDIAVQAFKAGVAAVLSWLVARVWLDDPMALLAPWVAILLVRTTVYGSIRQAAQQWTAVCVGTLGASAAQAVTGDTLGALALSVPLLMVLADWPRLGDQGVHAATTAVFTLASGAVSATALGHRVGQTALGAVIGVAVNILVLPPVHLRNVRENLAGLARETGELLDRVAHGLGEGDWDAGTAAGWTRSAAALERRRAGLRAARGWSLESLRFTDGPLRFLHRVPLDAPPETEDARWGRVTDHVTALTGTLAVAADTGRSPAPPDAADLRTYARLLALLGAACRAEGERLRGGAGGRGASTDAGRLTESADLRDRLQGGLSARIGGDTAHTAVLGTLLLQADNVRVDVLPAQDARVR
ncbi:aromatic acid exporter family protein [Streptomyces sp. NPDC058417]|uniref:FUSC family protein n=1 Tax=unclassified Streptomyces TaxID=2593676 RepID=UPI003660AD30